MPHPFEDLENLRTSITKYFGSSKKASVIPDNNSGRCLCLKALGNGIMNHKAAIGIAV
jgi:hypothetical protein